MPTALTDDRNLAALTQAQDPHDQTSVDSDATHSRTSCGR